MAIRGRGTRGAPRGGGRHARWHRVGFVARRGALRRGARVSADLVLREERAARLAAERDAERLAKLRALTAAFSGSLTPHDVASVALLGGCATLGAARGSVFLLGEGGAALEALRMVGYSAEAEARWR